MDSLAKEDNIRGLEESLQRLPEDLDRTYDDVIERIKNQDSRKRARADQILTLICCARRPLLLEELREALSVRKDDTFLDPRALPRTESVISACCGLVVVEDGSRIVKFVHYTAEEYFRRKLQRYRSSKAHGYFADILITYLNFTSFENTTRSNFLETLAKRKNKDDSYTGLPRSLHIGTLSSRRYLIYLLEKNILLGYASENWDYHVRNALGDRTYDPDKGLATIDTLDTQNLEQLITNLAESIHMIVCIDKAISRLNAPKWTWKYGLLGSLNLTCLHIAAAFGIRYFVEHYLTQGADLGARDVLGRTALQHASENGYLETARLLSDSGACY